ncbi:hypothetical protein D9M72_621340 [compost metagenome]
MHAIGMFVQVTGENQLVSLGLFDQDLEFGADFLRAADHRQAKEIVHGISLMGQPQAVHGLHWRTLYQALATHQGENPLEHRGRQEIGLLVGIGGHQWHAEHHVGLVQNG